MKSSMKNSFLICVVLSLIFTSCKKEYAENVIPSVSDLSAQTAGFQLVWSDEFTGTSVNTNNWSFDLGGGGWGNNELEYYSSSNATVRNGFLIITAKKQPVQGYNYTSARMKTQGKKEFTYGKIEARIKLPLAQGLWPAFWMLGANINTVSWPRCGEMDIMEHVNTDNLIYGTMHWDTNGYAYYGGNKSTSPANFHVYSIEWDALGIRWYIDGILYHTGNTTNNINGTEEFHKPFFILLNLAVGGNWPGFTIDETKLPAKMYVDYVRVYQMN